MSSHNPVRFGPYSQILDHDDILEKETTLAYILCTMISKEENVLQLGQHELLPLFWAEKYIFVDLFITASLGFKK